MRIFAFVMSLATIASWAQPSDQKKGIWEVLEGCKLVDDLRNNGDSFTLSTKAGSEHFLFRLYWVEALKTTELNQDRTSEQARYFAITEMDVNETGKLAVQFTHNFLQGKFKVITKWEDARGDPKTKCYYAMIQKKDQYLSSELLAAGLARLYGKPTEDKWPGGVAPQTYLGHLKNKERKAQRAAFGIWTHATGSLQMEGLEVMAAATVDSVRFSQTSDQDIVISKDQLNVNTATAKELDTLPGIGPALAARIIDARPILSVESMVQIPGISKNTLGGFSHLIRIADPTPPPFTVLFYKAELKKYLDSEVTVRVASVAPHEALAPESFRTIAIETAYKGEEGGSITAFIPEEFYDSFLNYYQVPGRDFRGLLYSNRGEVVLVYRRQ